MNTQTKQGILFAIGAYLMWGLAPIYFKQLAMVPAFEILTHRVVWSVVVLMLLVWAMKQSTALLETLKNPRRMLILLIAAVLLAINWLIYIWAVNQGRILEASLGYYINPLINVLLGRVILGEVLRPWQQAAVALVVIGVGILVVGFGAFPWIAISLAFSFSIYGLLRKMVSVGPVAGLTIETVMMLPVALFYLLYFGSPHSNMLNNSVLMNALLVSAGLLTTVPLLFFNGAAKRLKYSTLGFLQYIGPSIMFAVAVLLYGEEFTLERAVIFMFVWAGVVLFTLDSFRAYRQQKRQHSAL
ncbi:EamA family transporter RarD [Alteromonas sediminis]|uniref:EamA family transporter RarD n=1 Tax=Alteromonas sediminis TaxID=2259342 RepID=A0A3N5XXW0_9ALTE|nr:EamA family transporter RarD [Alteromonas sediminis]RPJ65360.1 EamA family transporter RarD [Alteromonas sediminis]